MVVDDEDAYRAYVVALAQRVGFTVVQAADGAAALELFARERFDALIIDQEMPRMKGSELIARIRELPGTSGVYAVMLTGQEEVAVKLTALNAGFDDFLTKSSSEPELVAKLMAVRRLVARQQTLGTEVQELYRQATRDDLTGVFNRRFFVTEADRILRAGTTLGLVIFDLDDFKQVNDRYGHLAGDRVLRDVGALFLDSTRSEDLIARYGGDEFVLVVASGPEALEQIADRIAKGIATLQWSAAGHTFGISASTGMASSALLPGADLEQLLDVADRDLYKCKWVLRHPDERPDLCTYPVISEGEPLPLLAPLPKEEAVGKPVPKPPRRRRRIAR